MKPKTIYAKYVRYITDRELAPVVLAILRHESQGQPGIISRARTANSAMVPTEDGMQQVQNAMGLMQVAPVTLVTYNQQTGGEVSFDEMIGKSEKDIQTQIQVGEWAIQKALEQVDEFEPVNDRDRLQLAICAYAMGIGNLRRVISNLGPRIAGTQYGNLRAQRPDWGRPRNNPHGFVAYVLEQARLYKQLMDSDNFQSTDPVQKKNKKIIAAATISGAILLICMLPGE